MYVPPFYSYQFIDTNGYLTPEAELFMASVNQAMLGALSDNGWTFPQKTTAEISDYSSLDVTPNGTVWFNTTTAKLNVKTASGVIEEITST